MRKKSVPKGKAEAAESKLSRSPVGGLAKGIGGAAIVGNVATKLYEGEPVEAVKDLALGAGAYKMMTKYPALVPLAVMASTISSYDEEVREDANAVGAWVEDVVGSKYVGAVAASGVATGESAFEGTFGVVGTSIGEGLAATWLWLNSSSSKYVDPTTPAEKERQRIELSWIKAGYH